MGEALLYAGGVERRCSGVGAGGICMHGPVSPVFFMPEETKKSPFLFLLHILSPHSLWCMTAPCYVPLIQPARQQIGRRWTKKGGAADRGDEGRPDRAALSARVACTDCCGPLRIACVLYDACLAVCDNVLCIAVCEARVPLSLPRVQRARALAPEWERGSCFRIAARAPITNQNRS